MERPTHMVAKNHIPARRPWTKPELKSSSIKEMTSGGAFSGADGTAMMMFVSDARLKQGVVRVGSSPKGIPIYEFSYVWGGPRYMGAMAQDLMELAPSAVTADACGYYRVDYSKLDVEFERAAGYSITARQTPSV